MEQSTKKRNRESEKAPLGEASPAAEDPIVKSMAEVASFEQEIQSFLGAGTSYLERCQALKASLETRHQELKRREDRLDEIRRHVEQCNSAPPLKINVGGTRFEVGVSSLQPFPESYLAQLVLQREAGKRAADDEFFIDRSPLHFELVLAFLQGVDLQNRLLMSDRTVLEGLLAEARFYGFGELETTVNEALQERWTLAPTVNGTLLDGGLTLVKSGDMGGRACITLGTSGFVSGTHEFSIVWNGDGAHVGVGVSRAGVHQTELTRNIQLFYALDCGNGRAIGMGGIAKQVVPADRVPPNGLAAHTRVSVRINLDQRTVQFGVDGHWYSPPFTNLPEGVYYPYFFLGSLEKRLTVSR